MEIIGEFFEKDAPLPAGEKEILYKVRKMATAVLFHQEKIGLIFVAQDHYHMLPSGKVEKDENLERALQRDILEKTGCGIKVRPHSVGAVIEYRDTAGLLEISYCYLADVEGDPGGTIFTKKEIEEGFQLEWQRLEDAISALEKDEPTDYAGKFIRQRDLLFLGKAKELVAGKEEKVITTNP
jgi:ADP-ribose pyrophosphatase YjhB (NUDIX family)